HTRMIYLLSVLPTRPPPTLTLFPYTTLFRSTQRSNKRTRAGYWNNPYPGLAALTHQAIARIADQWCTSVRYQCHIFAGLTFLNNAGSTLLFVVIVQRYCFGRNGQMLQQPAGMAGVFRRYPVGLLQCVNGTLADIVQIANRRRHYI